MLGECVISSVLSCCSRNLKWWTSVTTWLQLNLNGGPLSQLGYSSVLFGKQRKIYPQAVRAGQPKRRERFNFDSSFYMHFLLPPSLLYVNWNSQEGCLTWGSHSSPRTFLCSIFFFFFYFILLYNTVLLCHTLTWIHHGCIQAPNPESPSHLPPHIISLHQPQASCILYRT